ncbi:MAG: type II toxin-antitoxin system VapC family toxin [Bacteroidota bacterium]|nr:type II toxin-antitoxin system VapC family toxin [Bacteroidota bacterium]MDP4257634.1 type II toxin-antitoxin system VapC family toxin [Bacteroidota bacterium]
MESRIQRIYLDTSVIGGYYDTEFEEDTRILFEKIKLGQFHVVLSDITEGELQEAPEMIRNLFIELSAGSATKIELSEEAVQLADTYLAEKVVGKTSRVDCFHIALATIQRVDILVSWNFKHIVNVQRIRGYNSVNMKLGYPTIDIRSPKEIIYYEY